MYAHLSSFLAEGLQNKRVAGRSTPVKAVPNGLDPADHFELGIVSESPLDASPKVPEDLAFAIAKVCELGTDIDEWRSRRFAEMSALINKLGELKESLEASRTHTSLKCSSHVCPVSMMLLGHSIAWPDSSLVDLVTQGVCPLGPLPNFGIYRRKFVGASLSFEGLLERNKVFKAGLPQRRPQSPKVTDVIWEKSKEEYNKGWLSDFMSAEDLDQMFGKDKWSAIMRFAIEQGDKYRLIDDASDGQNLTMQTSEQIHTTSPAAAAVVASHYRKVLGRKLSRGLRLMGLVWI